MSRTQTISLDAPLFELIQTGTMLSADVNGEHRGALWQIVYPPVHLVPTGRPRYGTWSIRIRVYGTAKEVYGFHDNWPFPTNNTRGLWNELAIHAAEDLITRVDYTGPDGWTYTDEITFLQWLEDDRRPYLPQFSGHADATIALTCGVTNQGSHTVEAKVLGHSLNWRGFTKSIGDQHTPPSGQFAEIEVDEDTCSVVVNTGSDERFNAFVEGFWSLPLRTRIQVPCMDSEGQLIAGKKLVVAFGPFFGDQVSLSSPWLSEWVFERVTPLDEVFNFPAKQHWQKATIQHAFLNSATGNPDPPFPRTWEWGQRECLSGLTTVAIAVKREEFERTPLVNFVEELVQPLSDKRNWPRTQFHPAAEVTNKALLKLSLPEETVLPGRTWTSTTGVVDVDTLTATTTATFAATFSPSFECRPYRYLELSIDSNANPSLGIALYQGSTKKSWTKSMTAGLQTLRVDLCDPDQVNGTPRDLLSKLDSTNVAETDYRGSLTSRFSGIAGLTKIELTFAAAELEVSALKLVSDTAHLSVLGDGLTGNPSSEGRHLVAIKCDSRDGGRMSYQQAHLPGYFEQLALRHRLTVSDTNETIPPTFRHLYGGWRFNPPPAAYRFVSNVTDDLQRIGPQNLHEGAWIKVSITGRGYLLRSLICEDVMFGGETHDPFECRFDLMWGWDATTTAFGGGTTVQISRPDRWQFAYQAAPFGIKRNLPVNDGIQSGVANWFANPNWQRTITTNSLRQALWIGVEGSTTKTSVHSARGRLGLVATVETNGSTSTLYRNHQSPQPIPISETQDVVVCIGPEGWQEIAYVFEDEIWTCKTQSWGESWDEPMLVASGEEVAIATCSRTSVTVLAIYQSGTWKAFRRPSPEENFDHIGDIVVAEPARAGLEFNSSGPNELIFALPSEGAVRTFRSLDWGSTWQEIN